MSDADAYSDAKDHNTHSRQCQTHLVDSLHDVTCCNVAARLLLGEEHRATISKPVLPTIMERIVKERTRTNLHTG